jgi:alkanesulfonate monooxygenase SsuD/methylene tetrahydromethanopterin reductase-like flavin-dependent oxidoreductase (luciferase family)
MEFGIFDHLDRGDLPLADYYETRLKLIEAYDRAGFYSYHVAEHHFTPLGMAPSPSVFLAAVSQRTRRLRFGPLVYALPLYHPLRVLEEICMLDQMSGGRLDIGFGRGSVPIEIAYYGVDPEVRQQIYAERLELVLKAFAGKSLSFAGTYDKFENVPLELEPLQKPHPPIYYGAHSPDSAERAARKGLNIINNDVPATTRACIHRYRTVWREVFGATAPLPKMGVVRFIVIADSDATALATARRAYAAWLHNFNYLFRMHGRSPLTGERPRNFDVLMELGIGIAGTPETVLACLKPQLAESGSNYLVGQFAFGDLTLDEMLHSVALFARDVMPALRAQHAATAKTVEPAAGA